MIAGQFRAGHPRIQLALVGEEGVLTVDFILDTGFEGDLTLPGHLASRLGGEPTGFRRRALAGGSVGILPFYEARLEWGDGDRVAEVLLLEGQPLLGTTLMEGHLLQVEVTEGGEVSIEPL
jgi:clan AA aspartic protease